MDPITSKPWYKRPVWILLAVILVVAAAVANFYFSSQTSPQASADKYIKPPKPTPTDKAPEYKGATVGFAEDRVLVKFKEPDNQGKKDEVLAKHNLRKKSEIDKIKVDVLSISEDDTAEEVVNRLKEDAAVEFAEVDSRREPALLPDDPYYGSQWHLPKMSEPLAWDTAIGSDQVIIAILDTGADTTHSDLASKTVAGWNTYDNNSNTADVHGHGTAVAGTATALANNTNGVASSCWSCKLMPIRISDTQGYGYDSTVANGLIWAADHGARVANNSYAFWDSSTVSRAANYFRSKGGVVTMSAGNDSFTYTYPDNPDIIVVGATSSSDTRASWSNIGPMVDISGPGVGIYTTNRGGGYGSWSGTSFSAPNAAGVAGLVLSANPSLNSAGIEKVLKDSVDDLGTVGYDTQYGWGRLNAAKAVELAKLTTTNPSPDPTASPSPTPKPSPTSTPTPGFSILTNSVSGKTATTATITWTTSEDSTGTIKYGKSKNSLTLSAADQTLSSSHSLTISGLSPKTTYYYTITAVNAAGKSVTSSVTSFRTKNR